MEKLPIETFTSILLWLDPESRAACALTCKSWYSLACRSHVLYETIRCHDINTWMRRYRFFNSNKQYQNSVKTLEYNLANRLLPSDIKDLTTIYPDVRHFRLFFCEDYVQNRILDGGGGDGVHRDLRNAQDKTVKRTHACYQGARDEVFTGWHKLTSIEETSTQMYTAFILNCSTTPFNHLTSLWLNFTHMDMYRRLDSAMDYFIKGLRNSPQLKELTLLHSRISFGSLNMLHEHVPMIQTINLMNVGLSMYPSKKPATTSAATHLRAFRLQSCYFRSAEMIIRYVEKKYINLEHIVLDCVNHANFEPMLKSVVRGFITHATKLKSFKTNLFVLHPRFIKFMEDNGITEMNELDIGNHGDPDIPPIAEKNPYNSLIAVCDNKKFKTTLKTLRIHAFQLPNGFLDRYLELKNLTVLEVDFQANQGCEEDYMYGDYFDQEHIPEPVLSLTDLFRTLVHLKKLDLRSVDTTMDEELQNLHCIEDIYINGSHRLYTDEFGVAYSLFDFISNNCLQLRLIRLYGFTTMSNAPNDYQPVLDLSVHKHIAQVRFDFEFYRHVNEDGWSTYYSKKNTYFKKVQLEDITSKHLIIKSKDRKMFWTPKVPQTIRSDLEWDDLL